MHPHSGEFWVIDYRIYDPDRDGRTKLDHVAEMFASAQARARALDPKAVGPGGPMIIDRTDMRRLGGDLAFAGGALGGGRLIIDLPRAGAEREAA